MQGTAANGTARKCTIDQSERNLCTPTSLNSFNPLVAHSPFRQGFGYSAGASASGGSDRVTFFTSLDLDREAGVFQTNDTRRTSLRGNVRTQLRDNWDLAFNSGYVRSAIQLPVNDNSVLGIISTGLLGDAEDDPDTQGYYAGFTPDQNYNISNRQFLDRFLNSLTSNYQASSWLSFSGVAGVDLVNEVTRQVVPPDRVFFADLPQGNAASNSMQIFNWTAQGNATATFTRGRWRSATQLGAQYTRELFRGTNAFGAVLTSGAGGLNGTSARFTVGEFNTDNVLIGGFLQEQLSFGDRLFLTGAIRTDDNSAFGTSTERVYYPAFNASYVVSDEAWFPKASWLNSLRLRGAFGRSGQRPQFRNAITFFAPVAVRANDEEVGAITFNNGGVGNIALKPEVSTEFEGGLDASFFNERLTAQATVYRKTTDDALIQRPIPPSVGAALSRFENIGTMRNTGAELQLSATLLDMRGVRLEISGAGATNDNKLVKLGEGIAPIVFNGGRQIHRDGYAAGGYWQRPITSFADKNGDGLLSRVNCPGQTQIAGAGECEVVLGDTLEYLGNPLPKREFNVNPRLSLFNNAVRVSAIFDHRGGYKTLNLTSRFRCVFVQNCRAINDANAPLVEQAAALAGLMGTDAGFVEDGSFTRFRELSVTLATPKSWASRFGGRDLAIVLAGRNLALWTKYRGLDPEITSNPGLNFTSSDFLTTPPVRYFTARINLAF